MLSQVRFVHGTTVNPLHFCTHTTRHSCNQVTTISPFIMITEQSIISMKLQTSMRILFFSLCFNSGVQDLIGDTYTFDERKKNLIILDLNYNLPSSDIDDVIKDDDGGCDLDMSKILMEFYWLQEMLRFAFFWH